jgi:hypothetical protein
LRQPDPSRFTPSAGFYVELHLSCRSHSHEQILQGVSALVTGVEQLL